MALFDDILLVSDFDHSITGPDGNIPARNIEAVRYFIENGGTFTFCTGRSISNMTEDASLVPTNAPLLLLNGSAAYENGKCLYYQAIDLDVGEVLSRLEAEFPQFNLDVQDLYNVYLVNEKPGFGAFYDAMGWPHQPLESIDQIKVFLTFSIVGTPRCNDVTTLFDITPEEDAEFNRLQNRIAELWGDKTVTFRGSPRAVNIHAKDANKGAAAADLKKRLGKKLLVAMGDAKNDITMIQMADYGFCPADGQVAGLFPDRLVCPCGEGALAQIIYEKLPEILKKENL